MKKKYFNSVRELSVAEMQNVNGGSILKICNLFNGVKGDTEVYLFGIRIYHGPNAPKDPNLDR